MADSKKEEIEMPQRFLRPGLTTSQRFNNLGYQAQSFYVRLITLVDDFGRYEADPRLLRSHAFPLGGPDGTDIPVAQIDTLCAELSENDLAEFFLDSADQKKYLQMSRWQERARAEKSKFPSVDTACEHLFANVSKCSPPSSSPSPSSSPFDQPSFDRFWSAYPRKENKAKARTAFAKVKEDVGILLLAIERAKRADQWKKDGGKFIPHASSWLNGRRWEDQIATNGNGSSMPKFIPAPSLCPETHEEMMAALHAMKRAED